MTPDLRAQRRAVTPWIDAENAHASGVGLAIPLEDLDGGGLAGTVGTEQAEYLAGFDREGDAGERAKCRRSASRARRLRSRALESSPLRSLSKALQTASVG